MYEPSEENVTFDENNIIRTEEGKYEPKGGLGYEYFQFMKFYGDRIFQQVVDLNTSNTYSSILKKSVRTALRMKKVDKITPDDVVCLCTYNHQHSTIPFIASTFLGSKVASLDPTLFQTDVTHLLKQVQPSMIFLVPEAHDLIAKSIEEWDPKNYPKLVFFDMLRDLEGDENWAGKGETEKFSLYLQRAQDEDEFRPVMTDPGDTAVIFFSSGTTGLPKGICQSGYALCCQAVNMINYGIISSVNLSYSSLYWISAVLFLTGTILSGACRIICKSYDPYRIWRILDQYQISFIFLAPSQATAMLKAGRPEGVDTTSLHCLITGGGIFSEKNLIALRDFLPGAFVFQAYGQTEVAGILSTFNLKNVKHTLLLHNRPSSCGRPIDGICYKVVDPESEENLGPNQRGELRVQTKYQLTGYYNMDFSDCFDSEGWLRTGDIAYYDEDFCFYVVDRIKEMLKFQSWHIAPAALENILAAHPSVKTAVVIGIPHPEDGDHPMAVVVLTEGYSASKEELMEFVASQVDDRQKLRGGVKFVEHVPLTPTGKVKRMLLRKMVLEEQI